MEQEQRASSVTDAALRRRVENLLERHVGDAGSPSREDLERVVAEIEAARMVLEAENEELRSHQRRLEQYRDRYVDLYDFAPLGYVTLDTDGYVQEINLAGAGMLGQQPSSMTGYPLVNHVAAADQDRFLKHLGQCALGHVETTVEVSLLGRGRKPLPVQLHSVPIEDPDGRVTLCKTAITDLSERRQMEEALRATQAFLQTVIDAIPEALTVIDGDYRVVLANRSARQLAAGGDPRGGVLPCYRLLRSSGLPCAPPRESCPLMKIFTTGTPAMAMHTHRDADGNDVYLEINAAPVLDAAGNVVQVVELRRDVTAQKQAEEALRVAEERLGGE